MEKEDRQESALDLASDCEWVRALDESGRSIRIRKSDLLSTVMQHRGLVDYNNSDEINNTKTTGIYNHWSSLPGTPGIHGMLVVLAGMSYIAQIDISFNNKIMMRISVNNSESWSDWKSINLT